MQLDETSSEFVSNCLTLFKTEAVRCNLVSCGLSQESLLQIWRGFWSHGRKMNLMKLEMITLFWSLVINGYCWEWGVTVLKKKCHIWLLWLFVYGICMILECYLQLCQYVNGTTIVGSCKCTFTLQSQYIGLSQVTFQLNHHTYKQQTEKKNDFNSDW
jgi:hypothetical protein